jgi:LCP family protein required for cell wall assembly
VFAAFIVFKVTTGVYQVVQKIDPKDAVFALGTDLKQDEYGYTNIVLLGDGGHVRDGADLIDTIMVASIDFEGKSVSLLSIPRDYYLRYIPDKEFAGRKINEVYRDHKNLYGDEESYAIYQKVTGGIANLDVHYYARVDFNAFVEVVDSLGGITVDVKEPIYDPYYPNETDDGYTVFKIDAGLQEMNGETALKFVRSRKTTSDFDRSARQQQVLIAIRDKAMSVSLDTKTIKQLYESISNNLNTNLSLREMLALASFGKDFNVNRVVMKVLQDNNPPRPGTFLYTPKREYYDGQFVLVPQGNNLELIHLYSDLIFHHRDIFINPVKITVLNATKTSGIAGVLAAKLEKFTLNVVDVDNLEGSDGERKYEEKSYLIYHSWEADNDGNVIPHHKYALDALALFAKGDAVPSSEQCKEACETHIAIVLGADYNE